LYRFLRLVARGSYSRIGVARVRFNAAGDPVGVERLASHWSRKRGRQADQDWLEAEHEVVPKG